MLQDCSLSPGWGFWVTLWWLVPLWLTGSLGVVSNSRQDNPNCIDLLKGCVHTTCYKYKVSSAANWSMIYALMFTVLMVEFSCLLSDTKTGSLNFTVGTVWRISGRKMKFRSMLLDSLVNLPQTKLHSVDNHYYFKAKSDRPSLYPMFYQLLKPSASLFR